MQQPVQAQPCHPDAVGAAKVVLERRVLPGRRDSFEAWVHELVNTAALSPDFQGASVLTAGGTDYFVLLRFASPAALQRWQASGYVLQLLRDGDALAVSPGQSVVRTGMETWFALPGLAGPITAPPKWKMALLTWVALLPQVAVLALVLPARLPFAGRIAVSTAVPVALLTWVVMPALTRLLGGWLYRPAGALAERPVVGS